MATNVGWAGGAELVLSIVQARKTWGFVEKGERLRLIFFTAPFLPTFLKISSQYCCQEKWEEIFLKLVAHSNKLNRKSKSGQRKLATSKLLIRACSFVLCNEK
jgi:hypothetical protein